MDKKRLKELREEKAWFDKTMEAKSPEECKKVYASMPKGMLEIKILKYYIITQKKRYYSC